MTSIPRYAAASGAAHRRLRSSTVQASLLGLSTFALAACEEPVDLTFFSSVEQCREAAAESDEFSAGDCDRSFEQAMAEHATLAPRYDELALCEEQHGDGACAPAEVAGGAVAGPEAGEAAQSGGSVFMPFFMGYMMGNMLSSNRPGGYAGRALYSDTKGQLFTTEGRQLGFSGTGSKVRGYPSQLHAPNLTKIAAPMTRATVTARGGFGAARAVSLGG
jgi:uncharacterized protein YgiB involved in biofilm formation